MERCQEVIFSATNSRPRVESHSTFSAARDKIMRIPAVPDASRLLICGHAFDDAMSPTRFVIASDSAIRLRMNSSTLHSMHCRRPVEQRLFMAADGTIVLRDSRDTGTFWPRIVSDATVPMTPIAKQICDSTQLMGPFRIMMAGPLLFRGIPIGMYF